MACQGFLFSVEMEKTLIVIAALLILAIHGKSQTEPVKTPVDRNYEAFIKTYDAEFPGSLLETQEKMKPAGPKGFFPAVDLPAWLLEGWEVVEGRRTGIGISDPGMDSIQGFQQALVRALAMIALSGSCQIENVLDNYYLDKEGKKTLGKFNSFTTLFSSKSFSYKSIAVQKQMVNSNRETILLVSLTQDLTARVQDGEVKYLIENFESEQTETKNPFVLGKMRATLQYADTAGRKRILTWQRSYSPGGAGIESGEDSLSVLNFEKAFTYLPPKDAEQLQPSSEFSQFFTLEYGLWNAWQSAVVSHLEQLDVFASQVKNLDEQSGKGFQGLTRVIFSGEGGFWLKRAIVKDNQVSLEFE